MKRTAPANKPKPTVQLSPQQQEQFNKELAWCVNQLELGLQRPDVDKEQEKESKSVIDKLTSTKLNVVQKRHLMAVVFGDYRKYMREDEKQTSSIEATNKNAAPTATTTDEEEKKRKKKEKKLAQKLKKQQQGNQTESTNTTTETTTTQNE